MEPIVYWPLTIRRPNPDNIEHKRHGRKEPYTEAGVRRLPCARCGRPATHQWQVCSDGNLYRPICKECDILLNKIALWFMQDPDWESKMQAYEEKLDGEENLS